MAEVFVRVIDVLRDLKMAFAAGGTGVVKGVTQALQFILVSQVMSEPAQRLNEP